MQAARKGDTCFKGYSQLDERIIVARFAGESARESSSIFERAARWVYRRIAIGALLTLLAYGMSQKSISGLPFGQSSSSARYSVAGSKGESAPALPSQMEMSLREVSDALSGRKSRVANSTPVIRDLWMGKTPAESSSTKYRYITPATQPKQSKLYTN